MLKILAILGAPDPEMAMVEDLLRQAGLQTTPALLQGRRVRPHEAYASGVTIGLDQPASEFWLVECQPELPPEVRTVVVDHHRPGDPGYGKSPDQYWEASSLGQVATRLVERGYLPADWTPSQDQLLAAAADHCLAAAYQGSCPGVNPDALLVWRAKTRAAFQRRPVEDVMADVQAAMASLQAAPVLTIAGVAVADLRNSGTIPELPEAAARSGQPFLATLLENGIKKTVLQAAPPQAVKAWMEEQASLGLSPYGDPQRGFAGVILPQA